MKIENRQVELVPEVLPELYITKRSAPLALIVEDSKACAKLLKKSLEKCNVDAVCVCNGQEAVDEVRKEVSKYAIILMDNVMPVMNGIEATKIIRNLGYDKPIIATTGSLMADDVKMFMENGATEVLGKPIKMAELKELLLRYSICNHEVLD